jgi:hypothetical protein
MFARLYPLGVVLVLFGCDPAPAPVSAPTDPLQEAASVRAFIFSAGLNGGAHQVLRFDGTEVPKRGIALTRHEVELLRNALTAAPPPPPLESSPIAMCIPDPHHSFVLYDRKDKIIGIIDICFTCYGAYFYGSATRIPERRANYRMLERVVVKVGLPLQLGREVFDRLGNQ